MIENNAIAPRVYGRRPIDSPRGRSPQYLMRVTWYPIRETWREPDSCRITAVANSTPVPKSLISSRLHQWTPRDSSTISLQTRLSLSTAAPSPRSCSSANRRARRGPNLRLAFLPHAKDGLNVGRASVVEARESREQACCTLRLLRPQRVCGIHGSGPARREIARQEC
jgi:hypothetical protein